MESALYVGQKLGCTGIWSGWGGSWAPCSLDIFDRVIWHLKGKASVNRTFLKRPIPLPILLTTRELDYGGIERDVVNTALNVDLARFAPHVASYQASGVRHETLKRAGIPLLHLPFSSLHSKSVLSCAAQLYTYLKKHRIQIVHAWDTSAVFVAPLARMFRVPRVVVSTLTSRNLLDRRSRIEMRLIDQLAHAVVVNCEYLRAELIASEGTNSEKLTVCRNGIDTSEFRFDRRSRLLRAAEAPITIRTVCVLRPEKRVDLLLQAFAELLQSHENLQLFIIGEGPEGPQLRKYAEGLGLASNTIFMSAVKDVARHLQDTDIFVLCSSSEASSNALLEAMACGCCCLVSRVGGNTEIVDDGRTGVLFQPDSADDLCTKLKILVEDTALRWRLGQNAAEYAHRERSIAGATGALTALYEQLML